MDDILYLVFNFIFYLLFKNSCIESACFNVCKLLSVVHAIELSSAQIFYSSRAFIILLVLVVIFNVPLVFI